MGTYIFISSRIFFLVLLGIGIFLVHGAHSVGIGQYYPSGPYKYATTTPSTPAGCVLDCLNPINGKRSSLQYYFSLFAINKQ